MPTTLAWKNGNPFAPSNTLVSINTPKTLIVSSANDQSSDVADDRLEDCCSWEKKEGGQLLLHLQLECLDLIIILVEEDMCLGEQSHHYFMILITDHDSISTVEKTNDTSFTYEPCTVVEEEEELFRKHS